MKKCVKKRRNFLLYLQFRESVKILGEIINSNAVGLDCHPLWSVPLESVARAERQTEK